MTTTDPHDPALHPDDAPPLLRLAAGARRLLVPSLASVGVHIALLALLATVTWSLVAPPADAPRPGLEVLLDAPSSSTPEPLDQPLPADARADSTPAPLAVPESPTEPPPVPGRSPARAPALNTIARDLPAPIAAPRLTDLKSARPSTISFAGVRGPRAESVVFVVDASGAMTTSLPFVLEELARTIDRLREDVRFDIIVFRDRSTIEAARVAGTASLPPAAGDAGLRPATPLNRAAARDWLRTITPSGRSNPLDGLDAAFELEEPPDVVFLLARSIRRTENTTWGAGLDAIMERLDRLNPPRPAGDRRTQIRTIQFIDDDPTGIMQAIATRHGGGIDAYSLRTIDQLRASLDAPDPQVALDRTADSAAELLASLSADATDLFVLFGLASDEQRTRAREVSVRVLERLGLRPEDPYAAYLAERALAIRALASGSPDTRPARALDLDDGSVLAWLIRHARRCALVAAGRGALAPSDAEEGWTRRPDDLDPLSSLEAALLSLRIADAGTRDDARERVMRLLTSTPLAQAGRADPVLRVLAADAEALGARDAITGRASVAAVFAPHQRLLDDPELAGALGLDATQFEDFLLARLAALATPDMDLAAAPPRALLAEALEALAADPRSPRARQLLRSIIGHAQAGPLARQAALLLARTLLDDPAPSAEPVELLLLVATRWPTVPGAADAIERALHEARRLEATGAAHAPLYERVLNAALTDPSLRDRAFWRAELDRLLLARARASSPAAALDDLEHIAPDSPLARPARDLYEERIGAMIADASAGLLGRDGLVLADPPRDRWLAAVRLVERRLQYASERDAGALRDASVQLARLVLTADPARAETFARAAAINATTAEERRRAQLVQAEALTLLGKGPRAFELLSPMLDGSAMPDSPEAWHAWTLALEILAARARDDELARARTHLARLRALDPELGGGIWRERLERVADRLEP